MGSRPRFSVNLLACRLVKMTWGYIGDDGRANQGRPNTKKLLHHKKSSKLLCLLIDISAHVAGKDIFVPAWGAQFRVFAPACYLRPLSAMDGEKQDLCARSRDTTAMHERERKRAAVELLHGRKGALSLLNPMFLLQKQSQSNSLNARI